MRPECYFCHIRTIEKLIEKFKPINGQAEDFIFSIHDLLGNNRYEINPKLATEIHRIAKEKLNIQDLYAFEKISANKQLLNKYKYWREFIDKSENHPNTFFLLIAKCQPMAEMFGAEKNDMLVLKQLINRN